VDARGVRLGLAELDGAQDTVRLVRDGFVPQGDSARMLQVLGRNVGAHLEGAVDNVLHDSGLAASGGPDGAPAAAGRTQPAPAPPQPPTLTPPSPADRLRAATAALALVDAPLPPPALDASIGSGGSHGLPPRPSPRPSAAASPRLWADGKRKPPAGLCYLGTEDFRHGQTTELTRAETEAFVLVDGLHEPMDPSAVDLAGFVIEQRHHTNLPTIISTVLSPDELGPWLRYHRYDAADSLVARLGHAPSALVIDCVAQRLPDAPAPALPAHAYGPAPVRLLGD
jgi:hypothetical protein